MKTAQDYPVTFGYGAVDGVYYTKARPHRGNDRPTPTGTPVVIGDTTIGLTGNTGLSSAAHLHTQAGTDFFAQQTIDPTKHEFQLGKVAHVGNASEWGNFVILQNNSGVFVVYAHLSKITAKVGQIIKEDSVKIGTGDNWKWRMNRLHRQLVRNGNMSDAVFKSIQGKDAWKIVESWSDHREANQLMKWSELGEKADKENWLARLVAAEKAAKESAKTVADLKAAIENTTTKTKAEKDDLIMQLANLTENLAVTQAKYDEAKKKAEEKPAANPVEIDLGVNADTRSWIEKLINLFRR